MLLPGTQQSIRDLSLRNHLALAAFRAHQGNEYLLRETIRMTYLTYFLQRDGFGDTAESDYVEANSVIERAALQGERDGVWSVPPQNVPVLERILSLHNSQLTKAPLFARRSEMTVVAFSCFDRTSLRLESNPTLPAAPAVTGQVAGHICFNENCGSLMAARPAGATCR